MNLKQLEEVLYKYLSTERVKNFQVKTLCEVARVSRGSFYYHFKGIEDFSESVFIKDLNRILLSNQYDNFSSRMLQLLKVLKDNQIFYTNLVCLGADKAFGKNVEVAMFEILRYYARGRGCYSEPTLVRISKAMYHTIYYWIMHNCEDQIHQIHTCLFLQFQELDRQKELHDTIGM
ncbi:TetR/AcrR family transcriptional regulator [Lactobacillus mulieris]|uniref:TetR/AcrR family transcriptional regulator n=1 Tax=Lactobacillus mulieris TaxID=2508708 RepID=A0AAW5WZQ2_9LACO|nr:TetR/AcrR family transcriptional regulator [Lactobacillus mulieris]MCZ3622674.1 TetR/AcrR family transcriptional regulator [Lactobacillus mulieris]MCZ3624349.1 TetR/AcrR family transcriptional regulator [Lactobacillus mulieris]MCZ3636718.1 TetR/AcrR family transcriptional regulator [Lactobacillus mulieris]MCZ3690413.1 TetR/AcrR family transcriptional regulator [Lactobacillus mulieris]MCZ3696382.1 TetR/AcrR family transcriptional regulator [Lactobacillus mulieris]